MFCTIKSACIYGLESIQVNVEVSATTGLPQETIIGLPDTVVKESRNRVKSGIILSGYDLPAMAYTINLSPSDIIKRNTSLELAISVGFLQVSGQISLTQDYCFIGSLSLNGHIKPVRHLLPMLYYYNGPKTTFVISKENFSDIQHLNNINYKSIQHLDDLRLLDSIPTETAKFIPPSNSSRKSSRHRLKKPSKITKLTSSPQNPSFDNIIGHDSAKKACVFSVVGKHPMLFIGSPGIGKTLLVDHISSLIPLLSNPQAIENTCIESLLQSNPTFSLIPPYRAPHHTITYAGMIGGQNPPKPGEITRANHGILFLDELGEYQRSILETLREPMETNMINISRAGNSVTFPANFLLIAAMNPCYCGHYFNQTQSCQCSPTQINMYWKKISKPLLDRFSMCLILSTPKSKSNNIRHKDLVDMVNTGTSMANKRNPRACPNQDLELTELLGLLSIDDHALSIVDQFIDRHYASIRAKYRLIKLSLTIADCYGHLKINKKHVTLATHLSQHHHIF